MVWITGYYVFITIMFAFEKRYNSQIKKNVLTNSLISKVLEMFILMPNFTI